MLSKILGIEPEVSNLKSHFRELIFIHIYGVIHCYKVHIELLVCVMVYLPDGLSAWINNDHI